MARIGLVLGAGGVVGHAFHAGVLSALAEETGWDPRSAEVIVGTSAGSVVSALLRAGLSAEDLAARALDRPLSPAGQDLVRRAGYARPTIPSRRPRPSGPLRMAAPGLLAKAALRPWQSRPAAVAAGVLPSGRVPTEMISSGLRPLFPSGWPAPATWICAVRLDNGRRDVFGRAGAPSAALPDAVAASCAIPGFFSPVTIDGVRYVDGGVHSPTNADVVGRLGLDLVLISSPMSAAGRGLRLSVDGAARAFSGTYLRREVAGLRRRGVTVVAFQPVADDLAVMGVNAMEPSRRGPVTQQVRESTLRRLRRATMRDRLRSLVE